MQACFIVEAVLALALSIDISIVNTRIEIQLYKQCTVIIFLSFFLVCEWQLMQDVPISSAKVIQHISPSSVSKDSATLPCHTACTFSQPTASAVCYTPSQPFISENERNWLLTVVH